MLVQHAEEVASGQEAAHVGHGDPWSGYRQLCETFLNPLFLQAHRGVDRPPACMVNDGTSMKQDGSPTTGRCRRARPWWSRLGPAIR